MGYIAPAVPVQYEDYKRRIEQAARTWDPMPVTPASKVEPRSERFMLFYRGGKDPAAKGGKIAAQLFEPTGKGRYINEYV
ncbi:hypothetical protein [Siminovitchia sp. 179-K 8D1 HS]|uniref:hypothetical protein n=1 Tax=Siminovitchia sp. 179-K 8D1 HS TaxID=3142385 RepID=UPI0039A32309